MYCPLAVDIEYAISIFDSSFTTIFDVDLLGGDDRTRYRTPSDNFTIGLDIKSASILRSPSSRQDSISVHFAYAGCGS